MTIAYASEAQKAVHAKITPWLQTVFDPERLTASSSLPQARIRFGSAVITISVEPWNDDAVVCVRANVVTHAELTPDLLDFLLRSNHDTRFGAFGLDESDTIFFEHALLGSAIDQPALQAAVAAVARTADEYDDQIVIRWGGERAIDR